MSGSAPEIAVAYVSIVPEIQGFARQLRQQVVGPAGDAGDQAGEAASGGLKSKLLKGGAIAGIAAGAVIAKGLADAIDQANIKSKLQAQLGASNADAAKYGKVAGKLYSTGVSDSFESAAESIKAVMQSGIAPPKATNAQLQSIATKAQDVASTFDQDLGGVTNAVSQMIRTGLAKNSTEAFDIITKGFQGGADKAGDLLDTFNEYGTQFRKLGLDGTQALGLIQQGLKGGARDGDLAADALKEFSIRSVDGSATTAQGFKMIGLNAKDMAEKIGKGGKSASGALSETLDKLRGIKDPVKQAQAATSLFGTQAEDLGKALYAMDPSKAVSAVGKVGGAAKAMGDNLRSGPSYELDVFKRRITQFVTDTVAKYLIPGLTQVGSAINTYFVPGVKLGVQWFSALAGFIRDYAPYFTALTVLVSGLTLALKAQAIWTGITATVTKGVTAVTEGWAAAQALLNAVMALNPFVLVAIALAALVAGIVVAYNHSETFRTIVQAAFKAVGAAGIWLWEKAIKPGFTQLGAISVWLYQKVIKPYFSGIGAQLRETGAIAMWLYHKGIKPAFQGIATVAAWVWTHGVKEPFSALKQGVHAVADAFSSAKKNIASEWGKLKSITKAPVSFIIDTVYNKGIAGVWNSVAKAFGAPKLPEFHPKGFATGGILPGYTPGRDVHLAALSGGESIMRPEFTRAAGPGWVNSMNALARKGGVGAVQKAMGGGLPAFKDGGIFGWIGSAVNMATGAGSKVWDTVKKGAGWLKDTLAASARAGVNHVVNPLISQIPGLSTGWGQALKGLPKKAINTLFGYAKTADAKGASASMANPGGAGVARWKPYVIKALQANNLSTSGGMVAKVLRQIATESGGNPKAVQHGYTDVNTLSGDLAKGLMQTISATFNAYKFPGHGDIFNGYDNLLAALNYAKHRYGPDLSALGQGHGYDNGGWLQPGAGMTVNATGKPEPVFTNGQWSLIEALAARGAVGGTGGLQAGDRLVLTTGAGTDFEVYVDHRADSRIKSGLTGPATLGRTL